MSSILSLWRSCKCIFTFLWYVWKLLYNCQSILSFTVFITINLATFLTWLWPSLSLSLSYSLTELKIKPNTSGFSKKETIQNNYVYFCKSYVRYCWNSIIAKSLIFNGFFFFTLIIGDNQNQTISKLLQ